MLGVTGLLAHAKNAVVVGPKQCCAWLAQAVPVPVAHCHDAHALVLEHNDGWKLVYSGDTQPCARLAAAASGATLLIHEATFEPDLVDQARKKRHSTSAEALETSRASGAFRTVLTHFSQRYPGVPGGLPTTGGLHEVPIVAFDGTRVRFGDLPALPLTTPLIAAALDSTAAREKAVDGVEA
ncbi:unnamed protein product [Pedinophyceae sp. YPF-701]|nr:unnamed protein product [Pedinophyceae sp. YPF-701]